MTTKEVKLMIIQNFITHIARSEGEEEMLNTEAFDYVDEDWVDEIEQAGYVLDKTE